MKSVRTALIVVMVLLGAYVGGYFAFTYDVTVSPTRYTSSRPYKCRSFRHFWLIDVYEPMRAIESAVTNVDVEFAIFLDLDL